MTCRGLPEMSAFYLQWPIYIINSVDKKNYLVVSNVTTQ